MVTKRLDAGLEDTHFGLVIIKQSLMLDLIMFKFFKFYFSRDRKIPNDTLRIVFQLIKLTSRTISGKLPPNNTANVLSLDVLLQK